MITKRNLLTILFVSLISATITIISKQFGWDPNRCYFIAILILIFDMYGKLDDIKNEK